MPGFTAARLAGVTVFRSQAVSPQINFTASGFACRPVSHTDPGLLTIANLGYENLSPALRHPAKKPENGGLADDQRAFDPVVRGIHAAAGHPRPLADRRDRQERPRAAPSHAAAAPAWRSQMVVTGYVGPPNAHETIANRAYMTSSG
ncbi:hypothetical protein Mth01_39670 [Sphaerimonospora thailandensis]|uniref:Uncharacterized protein n=1 Tax=Sphaerimonospora thailandensis TaxID=795644 RepID=A0A8J3RBM6_9ACTN|nr:hypothetical protein Mth01_39670 [Sphaerimonospora thailandensis]